MVYVEFFFFFFFFKQKTAYEIKECDWSSDVCSSDLASSAVSGFACGLFEHITDTGWLPLEQGQGLAVRLAAGGGLAALHSVEGSEHSPVLIVAPESQQSLVCADEGVQATVWPVDHCIEESFFPLGHAEHHAVRDFPSRPKAAPFFQQSWQGSQVAGDHLDRKSVV